MYNVFCFIWQYITNDMVKKNHSLREFKSESVVCGVTVEADGNIYANSDYRKGGDVSGIDPLE